MQIDYPFKLDGLGRTTLTDQSDHIRDMIEQVLFTTPGERVNRPTFGCGLLQLVFGPNSDELATTTQYLVQGALQQWLGDIIQLEQVEVHSRESVIEVIVVYIVRRTQQRQVATISREV
jgi:phage baseplate assembly protein W